MPEESDTTEVLPHYKIPYSRCPKYDCHALTTAQLEEITLQAAKKAVELVKTEAYVATGTFVITKVGYIVGFTLISIIMYLTKAGIIEWK